MIEKIRARGQLAFTLLEILIVVAIIAFLSVAFLPNILNAPKKARDTVRIKTVSDIQSSLESFYADKIRLPTASGDECFTKTVADALGMKLPRDAQRLNSCGSTATTAGSAPDTGDADHKDKYFYSTSGTGANIFYIVGTNLETAGSSNTNGSATEWAAATTITQATGLKVTQGSWPGYIAVGPL